MPRRGDVVTIAGTGFAKKPRPAVVIQDDIFQGLSTTVVLMFTTHEGHDPLLRPEFVPTAENGLIQVSKLMIHVPTTVRLDEVGKVVGALSKSEMAEIDRTLMLLLGLTQ